ncbi:MAG TPA: hypothetical protein VFQ61_33870, partial [Polyangiaceae bacterium]|nr:hypothetical protein [Polyangiaceae bacterium]
MIELQECETEPIHTPAAIQPHGALLAFAFGRGLDRNGNRTGGTGPYRATPDYAELSGSFEPDLILQQFSANAGELLGLTEPLRCDQGIRDILPAHATALREAARALSDSTPREQQTLRVSNDRG